MPLINEDLKWRILSKSDALSFEFFLRRFVDIPTVLIILEREEILESEELRVIMFRISKHVYSLVDLTALVSIINDEFDVSEILSIDLDVILL